MSIKVDVFIVIIKDPSQLIDEYKSDFYHYINNTYDGFILGNDKKFKQYVKAISTCMHFNELPLNDSELASNYVSIFFHSFLEYRGLLGNGEQYSRNVTFYKEYQEYLESINETVLLPQWKHITNGRTFSIHHNFNATYEYGWTVGYWKHAELYDIGILLEDIKFKKPLDQDLKMDLIQTINRAFELDGSVIFLLS